MARSAKSAAFGVAFKEFNTAAGLPKGATDAMAEQWMLLFDLLEQVDHNIQSVGLATNAQNLETTE